MNCHVCEHEKACLSDENFADKHCPKMVADSFRQTEDDWIAIELERSKQTEDEEWCETVCNDCGRHHQDCDCQGYAI